MSDELYFNGINASTGDYLVAPMTAEQLATHIVAEKPDETHVTELKEKHDQNLHPRLLLMEGFDSTDLAQAGWGVIFAAKADPEIRKALSTLIDHRKNQAGSRFKEFSGTTGFQTGETKLDFLRRNGAGMGPVNPAKIPYYLLIVGDPETIPFHFQYQLDVQHAVGRIHFETLAEYRAYAQSVVEFETTSQTHHPEAAFFGVKNDDDPATKLSCDDLVNPLADEMQAAFPHWKFNRILETDATTSRLAKLLGGNETPSFLFTASHGAGFSKGDARQLNHQGALICQEWPGRLVWKDRPLPPEFYFSADTLSTQANVWGMLAFHFACYGAGTPRFDDFPHLKLRGKDLAATSFLAALPKKMLAHPNGGALAVIGHIDLAWGYSFVWQDTAKLTEGFHSVYQRILKGMPVGYALEYFNNRYAEISTELSKELYEVKHNGKISEPGLLSRLWTANNDARSFVILGDPAVKLRIGNASTQPADRPSLNLPSLQKPDNSIVSRADAGKTTVEQPHMPPAPPEIFGAETRIKSSDSTGIYVETLVDSNPATVDLTLSSSTNVIARSHIKPGVSIKTVVADIDHPRLEILLKFHSGLVQQIAINQPAVNSQVPQTTPEK